MATDFSALPVISLAPLKDGNPSQNQLDELARQFHDTFVTTGFAYLVDYPLDFGDDDVFGLAREFFTLPLDEKMKLAKKSFRKENNNTYRGYFPTQPNVSPDNLKEGFEMGPSVAPKSSSAPGAEANQIWLNEPNRWPQADVFPARDQLEKLHQGLQSLASSVLKLLALSLGKPSDFFASYLVDSLSTLRLLHYPPVASSPASSAADDSNSNSSPKLSCSPHTDSGILTLLHQDPTGGLEVQNSNGDWVPAPYIKDSIVVNIGDLMAKVSGGRFVATMHRVRAPKATTVETNGSSQQAQQVRAGRFSVPFFFEPGEACEIKGVDETNGTANGTENGVTIYGPHVRAKMKTWVEFQGQDDQ